MRLAAIRVGHVDADEPRAARAVLAFANALVDGRYDAAHGMLAPALRVVLPASELLRHYESMLSNYAGKRPTDVSVVMTDAMRDWVDRRPGDLGWAYVAISGDGWSEAVAGVVEIDRDRDWIRLVDFGRP